MSNQPKRNPADVPADANLCQILLFTDVAGERPPILCIHDFKAMPPKQNGYMLRGERLELGDRAMWRMILSNGSKKTTLTSDATISPIQLVNPRLSVGLLTGMPKAAPLRSELSAEGLYPEGVQYAEVLCLAEDAPRMLAEILKSQADAAYEAVRMAQRNIERLQELAGDHGVQLPTGPAAANLQRVSAIMRAPDGDGWDHAAIEGVAARASACLEDTPAAAAARDAVSGLQVIWRNAPAHKIDVLGDLEDAIGLLAKVRDAAAAEAMRQLREQWKRHLGSDALMAFTARNGIPFCARLIFQGDGYGRWGADSWAMTHDKEDTLIEFHDQRYFHNPLGQFTGGRYLLETLTESRSREGLALDGGVPEWTIDADSLDKVLAWATEYVAQREVRQSQAPVAAIASDAHFVSNSPAP